MRNSKYAHITIGGVDYSAYLRLPLTVQQTLNEQLDSAVVELTATPLPEPLKPFSRVLLGDTEYILADDTVTEKIGQRLYTHTLTLIEPTKEAERIICSAKAFTRPLVRKYTDGNTIPRVTMFTNMNGGTGAPNWKLTETKYKDYPLRDRENEIEVASVVAISKDAYIGIPALADLLYAGETMAETGLTATISVYYNPVNSALKLKEVATVGGTFSSFVQENGTTVVVTDYQLEDGVGIRYRAGISNGAGVYTVRYEVAGTRPLLTFIYDVSVVEQDVKKGPLTVADVINRLLKTAETLRDGLDAPRYALEYSAEQKETMEQEAPEFRFSNGRSLWENLREIGKYIHAIPRITGEVVTFDQLGGAEYADLSKGKRVTNTSALNIGDYTSGLDTMASNLVNLDDEADGSVTEPYDNAWVTMRATEETARIKEETGILLTAYPVEKVIKWELAPFKFDGIQYNGADLTPYLFEKSEYDLLSNYEGLYPRSKSYAAYYTQGGKNIEGFWFKAQTPSPLQNALQEYSITNIIERSTGVSAGFFESLPYTDLGFRITYIPAVSAHLRQYKPDFAGGFPSVMVYNQSANKLSAKALGENLRGQLAMTGNASNTVTYMFKRMEDVPKAGTLYDDERYISSVTARLYNDFVVAQMTLTKGYNELGAFVETPNPIRQFEIPAAEDRYTLIEEFCLVSDNGNQSDMNTMATEAMRKAIADGFGDHAGGLDVSVAKVTTKDGYGQNIATVALPVVSLALGTSLYFGFRFEDNYSAGRRAVYTGNSEDRYKLQKFVPYGDKFYAEADLLAFDLLGSTSGTASTPDAFPDDFGVGGEEMVTTGQNPILWYKDSADAGCITYQIHMVTDRGYILGDGLTYHCRAIRKQPSTQKAQIYYYNHRINQLTGTTSTADAVDVKAVTVNTDGTISLGATDKPFKSWAIIKGGRFMLGKNSAEAPTEIYFNFKRRLPQ